MSNASAIDDHQFGARPVNATWKNSGIPSKPPKIASTVSPQPNGQAPPLVKIATKPIAANPVQTTKIHANTR